MFRIFSDNAITFGNFSCIPAELLSKITNNEDFWNHYSAAAIKSKIPYAAISTERGKRFFGESKMNFNRLVIHGLSSFSLYLEQIVVKFLKLSILVLFLSFAIAGIILYLKFFTTRAIPGWTSTLLAILINISLMTGFFTFLVVNPSA